MSAITPITLDTIDGETATHTATLSVLTATKPKRLAKQFALDSNGELLKQPGGELVRGHYERRTVDGVQGLRDTVASLQPNQALCFGIAAPESSPIASRKAAGDGDITRTRECFDWPAGPGFLLLDYDPAPGFAPMDAGALYATIKGACPAVAEAPMVAAASGSTFIYNGDTGECVKGAGGLRQWVHVADARDIPRAGQVLFDRLWLAGHGYYAVSKSGALLERGLIDAAVWQPERLDFAAGASCVAPLEQRRPEPLVVNADAAPLDTTAALPDLTDAERERLAEIKAEAREAVADDQCAARHEWITERLATFEENAADELAALDDDEREQRIDQARQSLVAAVTNRKLFGDFTLTHSSGRTVTVGEILDKPDQWHGERFADPLEPDYGNDARIAWANLRSGGRPYLFSHAHGGQRFALIRAASTLQWTAGESPRLIQQADELMRHAGEIFQRGGELVRVADGGLLPVTGPWLRTHLETIARFERFDKRAKGWVATDAPGDLHARILHNRGAWGVPELQSVIRAPVLRPDGSLLDRPGYDAATRTLLLADHPDGWPAVPANPTRDQVRTAIATLWEPFAAFPFVDDLSRAIALAAMLTAVQRPMLETAPGFATNSYKAGTGKGKLAKGIAWLGGHEPVESPWSTEADEQRKRIMAKLLTAPASLLIDNVNGALDSDTLCAVLTSSTYEDRRLGASENISVPTRVLVMATGNNIAVTGDLSRRVLVATIDHGVEAPERLAFGFDPVARVRGRWMHYRAAALAILRGFIAAGSPQNGPGCMGSFEAWDSMIRQCVVWLRDNELAPFGLADPADAVAANYQADPDTQKLRALLAAWESRYGGRVVRVGDLVTEAAGVGEHSIGAPSESRTALLEVLQEIAGEPERINRRRLGRWIERHAGRPIDGLKIEDAGSRAGTRQWKVGRVG